MKTKFLVLTVVTLLLIACQTDSEDVYLEESSFKEIAVKAPRYIDIGDNSGTITTNNSAEGVSKLSENNKIEIYMAEYITAGGSDDIGNVVFFNDRGNKQLSADFAPNRSLDGSADISYYIDQNRPTADMNVTTSTDAINRAMGTWDGITCSEFGLNQVPSDGRPTGWVAEFLGFPGSFDYVADVNHAGWMPAAFFDLLAPGGSNFILGVTFTLVFTSGDADNNGKPDVAAREIYYNDNFGWNDGSTFDVETVALHEAGHGLSQGHFGKAFRTISNGRLHFSPRAVMNASYSGIQTSIEKTDNAGHCSNWAEWPNN